MAEVLSEQRRPTGSTRRSLGQALDPQRNSLNFLRLVLAVCVVISHAYLDNRHWATDVVLRRTSLGTLAVYGFFALSGYLIAGSAVRNSLGRYLWQRVLRIMPAFWVAIFMTAFVFGVVAWFSTTHPPHEAGLHNYFSSPQGPWQYVGSNWYLKINQPTIAGVIGNSSLWTLFYEFCCYLLLGALALLGVFKRREVVLAFVVAFFTLDAVFTLVPSLNKQFNVFDNWGWMNFVKLATIFLVGALIYAYRESIPDSGWLALLFGVAAYAMLWLPQHVFNPAYYFTPSSLAAPVVAYPLLWLGAHLPFERVGAKNDYSYGLYIYAFPVQVVLARWGAHRWGSLPYAFLVIIATVPVAMASWWLIERHALKLKKLTVSRWRPSLSRSQEPAPPPDLVA